MTYLILVGLSCLIITLYLSAYICITGLPTSISDTYYHNERKWLLSTVLAVSASLALIPMMDLTREPFHFLSFISISAIFFVAASPAFKDDFVGSVHSGAAIILGVAIFAWLFLMADIPYIALVGIIVGIFDRKHFVFWLEVGLLYNLYFVLFLLLAHQLVL